MHARRASPRWGQRGFHPGCGKRGFAHGGKNCVFPNGDLRSLHPLTIPICCIADIRFWFVYVRVLFLAFIQWILLAKGNQDLLFPFVQCTLTWFGIYSIIIPGIVVEEKMWFAEG